MELARFPLHGGFSVRSILTFALAVIAAALLWIASTSTPAHAATDAHWGGDSIIYNDYGFTASTDTKDTTGTIPDGSLIYKTTIQNTGSGSSVSQKVFIIYFTPGVDPPTATTAKYVEFDYNGTALSNPKNQKNISLTDKSQQSITSSCAIDGVGWMICPISNFLANAMDHIFGWLAQFIETQPPILGDTSNGMYVAWNIMRTIANVAFVIVFLVIIYSQLTSIGVSNYGIKKLIPRLIVAAVLVNVSFYVAALAIDISNILGYSVQDIFVMVRKGIFHITEDNAGVLTAGSNTWGNVAAAVLGTGGLIGGAYYAASGGIYLLMPLLIGLLLTVMLVFLILAARQAVIICLVIIAPLAFVANLLPNTEKLFDKWKDLFMTMLVFFPAFSLVFGASQLGGQLIIQNASNQGSVNNIVMLIFGLAVQVAPLVITPLLLKLSGGMLGKIAQIANNPKKGLIDRNRNWAQARAEHAKQQNIARGPRFRNPASWGAAAVGRNDRLKRRLADSTDIWKKGAENRYKESKQYRGLSERRDEFDTTGQAIHDEHAAHSEYLKTRQGTPLHAASRRATVAKEGLETQQQHLAGYYNTLRTIEGTDLNASSLTLEAAKTNNQASEQTAAAYLNERRTFRTSQLGAAAERLEATKLNAEGWQNRYTAHIDSLKVANDAGVTPNIGLANAAVFAQSTKEHAEAAQNRVQVMFDRERRTIDTQLNVSTINLEGTKLAAETSKNLTARYLSDEKANIEGVLHVENTRTEAAKSAAQVGEARLKSVIEEYKAKPAAADTPQELADEIGALNTAREALAIETLRTGNATKVQNDSLAKALIDNSDLREQAGGINEQGADSALASAISTVRTAYGQSVNEARQIIKHFNLNSSQRQNLALLEDGESITVKRDDGTEHTFTANDIYAREAAIEDQIAVGTIDQVEELVQASGVTKDSAGNITKKSLLADYRTTIADALGKNSLGSKSLYLGGKTIDDVTWGRINSKDDVLGLAIETIAKGKISEKDLANADPIAVGRLLEAAQRIKSGDIPAIVEAKWLPDLQNRLVEFSEVARNTLTGEESVSVKSKAQPYIEEIGRLAAPRR